MSRQNSFLEHDYREVCMGALFLASKVDETFRKIWDVADTFTSIFRLFDPNPVPFQTRELTHKIREVIVEQERIILKELGFELFRFSDQPHKFIASFFNLFKSPKALVKRIWSHLNDAYLTDLCVHFPPQVIAAGCIYLGMRELNHPMPQQPWWVLLESSYFHTQVVASTLLLLNDVAEKVDFKKVKYILSGFRESYIDNSFLIKQYSRQSNMKDPAQEEFMYFNQQQIRPQEDSQNQKLPQISKQKEQKSKERYKEIKQDIPEAKENDKSKKATKEKEREKDNKEKDKKEKEKRKHKKHKRNNSVSNSSKKRKDKKRKEKSRSREKDKEKEKEKSKPTFKETPIIQKQIEIPEAKDDIEYVLLIYNPRQKPSAADLQQRFDAQMEPPPPPKMNSLEKQAPPPDFQPKVRLDTKVEMERIKNILKLKKEMEEQQKIELALKETEEENKLLQLRRKRIARQAQNQNPESELGFDL